MAVQLQTCVTSDVSYTDTFTSPHVGIEKLTQTIIGIQQSFPGTIHALSGVPLCTNNTVSYCWTATLKTGKVIAGIDYLELTADGLISKVVSFTNKADWR